MTGLVRKAMLLSMLGLVVAGAAIASVPDVQNSQTPNVIRLTWEDNIPPGGFGANGAMFTPYAGGSFTIRVRDNAGNDIPNSNVVIDFGACGNDIRLSATQQPQGAFTLVNNCAIDKTVRMLTNGSGIAVMNLTGASNSGPPAGLVSPVGSARILADGVEIRGPNAALLFGAAFRGVSIAAYDIDGASGLTSTDRGIWQDDFFNVTVMEERSDFNGDWTLSSTDRGLWQDAFFFGGAPGVSPSPYCTGMW